MKERRQTNEARLESLLRISQFDAKSTQDLLDFALNEAIALTQSAIGYIYFYDEKTQQFTLNTWSKGVMDVCRIMDPKTIYELDKTGIWGEAVRQKRPIVVNDFSAPNPLKKGYPEGHAPLERFMTIPVISESRIVAVLGLANKKSDYTEADIRQVTLMMSAVWQIAERKRIEDALTQSRRMLDQVISTIPMRIFWKDTQLKYLGCNRHFAREAGLKSPQEIIGKTDRDLAWSLHARQYEDYDRDVLSTGIPKVGYEEEIPSPRGGMVWLRKHKVPLKSADGKIVGILGTYEDISEIKKDHLRIGRLAAIVEASYDAIIGASAEGIITDCNRGAQRIYGYEKSELLGRSLAELAPPDKHNEVTRILDALRQGRHIEFLETRHIRKNGEQFFIALSVSYILDEKQQMAGISIIGRDITEKKKSESELQRYRDFIENISDGCFEVDLKGKIIFANESVAKHMGYSREQLIGMNTRDYTSPEEAKRIFAIFSHVSRTGESATISDYVIRDSQGQNRYVEMSVSLIRDMKESPIGFRGTARDITEKRKAEENLQYISIHDSLTGLFNRFYADAEIERLAAGRPRPVSIVIIDLNELKKTNDDYGHARGDMYIKDAAALLKQTFRPDDMIARIGGDEFLVLLPLVDEEVCAQAVERLNEHIRAFNRNSDQPMRLSAGSATAQAGDNLKERIREADKRMYQQKASMKTTRKSSESG